MRMEAYREYTRRIYLRIRALAVRLAEQADRPLRSDITPVQKKENWLRVEYHVSAGAGYIDN